MTEDQKKNYIYYIILVICGFMGSCAAMFADIVQKQEASSVLVASELFYDLFGWEYIGMVVILFLLCFGPFFALIRKEVDGPWPAFTAGILSLSFLFNLIPFNADEGSIDSHFTNPGSGFESLEEVDDLNLLLEPDASLGSSFYGMPLSAPKGGRIYIVKSDTVTIPVAQNLNVQIQSSRKFSKFAVALQDNVTWKIIGKMTVTGKNHTELHLPGYGKYRLSIIVQGHEIRSFPIDIIPSDSKRRGLSVIRVPIESSVLPSTLQRILNKKASRNP